MSQFSFEQACELARSVVVSGAVANFAVHGEVRPISFIVGMRDPRSGAPLSTPALTIVSLHQVAHDKDAMRALQQAACDKLEALAHVYVTEGWGVILKDEDGVYADPYEGRASLSEHPDREESVLISLEHEDGTGMWRLPILQGKDGKRTLGPVQEDLSNLHMPGRMTGYLKPKRQAPEA